MVSDEFKIDRIWSVGITHIYTILSTREDK